MKESRWELFKNPNVSRYSLGLFLSALGDSVFYLTMAWMIMEVTGSGVIMATYLIAGGIPRIVMMLLGGVMADRLPARQIMIISDVLRAVIMGVLLLLCLDGTPPVWVLFVLGVLFGTVDAFYWPAEGVVRRRLVEKERFTQLASLLTGLMQLAIICGPLVGAMLLSAGGYTFGIAFNGVSFLISALTLFVIHILPLPEQQADGGERAKRSVRHDLLEGVRFVLQTPILLVLLVMSFFANMGVTSATVAMPFLADSFGTGAQGLSVISSTMAAGGILGSVLLTVWVIKHPTPRMVLLSFLLHGLMICIMGFVMNHWQAAAVMFVAGISTTAIQVIFAGWVQTVIPAALIGRVFSVMVLMSYAGTPIGQAAAGLLLDATSPNQVFFYGGVFETIVVTLAFLTPAIRRFGLKGQPSVRKEVTNV
jgi:predicted MFS family arabinose efflux permease